MVDLNDLNDYSARHNEDARRRNNAKTGSAAGGTADLDPVTGSIFECIAGNRPPVDVDAPGAQIHVSTPVDKHVNKTEDDVIYAPVCIICGRHMDYDKHVTERDGKKEYDFNIHDGIELTSLGEYGSTFWDEDFEGDYLSIVICDRCLENSKNRLHVRRSKGAGRWPKPITFAEYERQLEEARRLWKTADNEKPKDLDLVCYYAKDFHHAIYMDAPGNAADDTRFYVVSSSVGSAMPLNMKLRYVSGDLPLLGHGTYDGINVPGVFDVTLIKKSQAANFIRLWDLRRL